MYPPITNTRNAMTLVELLVVVTIIGLLALTVGPMLQSNNDNRVLSNAADLMSLHLSDASSQSIGQSKGVGVWLEGTNLGQPLFALEFARMPSQFSGTTAIVVNNSEKLGPPPTKDIRVPFQEISADAIGGRIQFLGSPSVFQLTDVTDQGEYTNVDIQMLENRNFDNDSFPPVDTPIPYQLTLPPRRKNSFRSRQLSGGACIDAAYSSIGLHGATSGLHKSLSAFSTVAVMFDALGRPTTAWLQSANGSLERHDLGPLDVLLLLIGSAAQVGNDVVAEPDENNPGANIQNPYAVWVVLDPKTGASMTVENNATGITPANNASVNLLTSQRFVRQKLGKE